MARKRQLFFLCPLALIVSVLQLLAVHAGEEADEAKWGQAQKNEKVDEQAQQVCTMFVNINSPEALAETMKMFGDDGPHWLTSLIAFAFQTRGSPKVQEICLMAISNVIWYEKSALDALRDGLAGYGSGSSMLLRFAAEQPTMGKIQESVLVALAALVEGEEGEDEALELVWQIDQVVLRAMKTLKKEKRVQKAGILLLSKLQSNRPVIQQAMLANEELVPIAAEAALKLTAAALESHAINMFKSLISLGRSDDDSEFADKRENVTRVKDSPKVFDVAKRSFARFARKDATVAVSAMTLVRLLKEDAKEGDIHPSIAKSALMALPAHHDHAVYKKPLIEHTCWYFSLDTDELMVVEGALKELEEDQRGPAAAHAHLHCADNVKLGAFSTAAKTAAADLGTEAPKKEEL